MVASFLLAVQFLTRVPVPLRRAPSERQQCWSTAFYPLVGVLVGLGAVGVFRLLEGPFSQAVAVAAVLAFTVLLTGGLHEDGLADCADALGAGGSRERMLEIMHDSRLGAYGTLALVLLFLFRFALLTGLPAAAVEQGLVLAHAGGRCAVLLLARAFPSASSSVLGAAHGRQVGALQILLGFLTLAAAGYWAAGADAARLLLPGLAGAVLFSLYSWRRLGGLTGDTLGASIVIFEVATYGALAWQGAAS